MLTCDCMYKYPYNLFCSSTVPYAWDEPTQPELLCLQVKGVSEVKEFDLNSFSDQGKVYYESYFHIVATTSSSNGTKEQEQFVLDVPQGRAVILTRKVTDTRMHTHTHTHTHVHTHTHTRTHTRTRTHTHLLARCSTFKFCFCPSQSLERRSQLWRMASDGQLVHISSSSMESSNQVLDIAEPLPAGRFSSDQFLPLIVAKMSSRYSTTQCWKFKVPHQSLSTISVASV